MSLSYVLLERAEVNALTIANLLDLERALNEVRKRLFERQVPKVQGSNGGRNRYVSWSR
jgi:hypothetical protein